MDKNELSVFPKNRVEALTMMYLEKQNTVGFTPEEFVALYLKTYEAVESSFGILTSRRYKD